MRTFRAARITILLVTLLALAACGGSSDSGSSGSPGSCAEPFSTTLSGIWFFQETFFGNSCGTNGLNTGSWTIVQSDRTLTFIGPSVFTATLCGSRASLNGSFSTPVNGGLHTVTQMTIQFQNATTATGTTTWSWQNTVGTESCSGTSQFDMTR